MSGPPPPPPPPHGESPKTTGLPPGKYDVFIIPEHSAGAGFLYLPSLRTNTNSFVAGFASALVLVVLFQSMAPAFQAWWANFQGMGNMGMMMLVIAVGLGAWSLGRQQQDGTGPPPPPPPHGHGGHGNSGGGFAGMGSGTGTNPGTNQPPPNSGPPPNPPPPQPGSTPNTEKPKPSWQQRAPPQPGTARAETPKNSWEKAREETRKREEERKAREEEQKRKEEIARRLRELREKEAREREQREKDAKERQAREQEAKERKEREAREREQRERLQREKERLEKEVRERVEREAKVREEKRRQEEDERKSRKASTYAYSGVGERTNPWPNGKPPAATSPQPTPPRPAARPAAASPNPSPTKKPPPAPTAKTFVDEDDAYSYRPYDKPKRPMHRKSNSDLSESSWAPSQSTARTTPPPSVRGPYTTKDPDKIVIRAVYSFMNQFAKTPASQLISGVGSVTDGLILRITTEGLFIDDDVRGVAQREWDVKAWTLKLVEVWCPSHFLASATASSNSSPGAAAKPSSNINTAFFVRAMGGTRLRAAERGAPKTLTGEGADAYLTDMLRACKDCCRLGLCASTFAGDDHHHGESGGGGGSTTSGHTNQTSSQTGDWKARGLHLLRATIRDQEGKRYLFVISEEESWKVAVGLQRLRRGTQVRALGVAGMSGLEAKSTLEMLGWGA
ncbi:hypothetical protein NKR23_g2933 [Pleurostoma richardsiae]|uniref:Trans-sialidase-like protein n=1 Tax=Pleurostoma richardsiae TaxID=41990 RepID=A0AA38S9N4_9PEZI|nr:hypothetical protein NKR23_g2933 [Pleurostoma richardsiae]